MRITHTLAALFAGLFSTLALGQDSSISAEGAWARATVQGQKASGVFMKLTAHENLQLVGALSPVAGVTEVHEMKMEGDVMRMRAVPSLSLPAHRAVELKPGGYHLMLMDLRVPLLPNSQVPVTLVFKDAKGVERRLELRVPVSAQAPAGAASGHGHKH